MPWASDGHVTCPECRAASCKRAKARYVPVPPELQKRRGPKPAARLQDVEAAPVPRCRCGLCLPCNNCLPRHADAWSRPGSGRTMPEPGGCGFTREEKRRMGTVESKFVRFTNAKRDAVRVGR